MGVQTQLDNEDEAVAPALVMCPQLISLPFLSQANADAAAGLDDHEIVSDNGM